ncbi:hypothetical protein CR513_08630, partial [Mucuna pruriens]
MDPTTTRPAEPDQGKITYSSMSWPTLSKKNQDAFDMKVRPRVFKEGDMVLKKILLNVKDQRGKWVPNYEGPYAVQGMEHLRPGQVVGTPSGLLNLGQVP